MPAFATTTVAGPRARSAPSRNSAVERASRTSIVRAYTREESPSREAARVRAASRKSPKATRAPASWNAFAMAKPIPAPAPVTSTTSLVKSSMVSSLRVATSGGKGLKVLHRDDLGFRRLRLCLLHPEVQVRDIAVNRAQVARRLGERRFE